MSIFVSINEGEEVSTNFDSIKANNMNLGNISRAKRSGTIMSLCSDIKSKKMPCAINGNYELHEIIAKGGCGTVLKGKEHSMSKLWCQGILSSYFCLPGCAQCSRIYSNSNFMAQDLLFWV